MAVPIHVLLVEDSPGDARLVREMLAEDGRGEFTLMHVPTVKEALAYLAAKNRTDAVLLDLSLPDESGLVTVKRVVAGAGDAVVVVMTGESDEDLGMEAVEAGAQDYLLKGQVDARLLRRALRFALRRGAARQQLEGLLLTDDLTGLSNRRGFQILAEQQLRLARRQRSPFLLIFLDLDGLKSVNDRFGHAEGNRALAEAAEVLRDSLRQSDIVARFGGDEFTALCVGAGSSEEAAVRERLAMVLTIVNEKPDRAYPLSLSLGVLRCDPTDERPIEALLAEADRLMYEDKRDKARYAGKAG